MTFKEGKVYESTAIGSNEGSPLEVAGAYATFGNSGNYNKPHFVKEVTFPDGKRKALNLRNNAQCKTIQLTWLLTFFVT